ncbi:hypothetical protein PIB30_059239 [Stylosanthes scabra]|uniref:Uncharacterized protein n=1 Tax=Stylosanthes scabra TaxID=79078 RepID=A0ABU6TJX8_9FABA|nr:hypothetical protein [Stylosanthes scabra]
MAPEFDAAPETGSKKKYFIADSSEPGNRNPLPDYKIVVQARSIFSVKVKPNRAKQISTPSGTPSANLVFLTFHAIAKGQKKWQMIDLYHDLRLKSRMTQREFFLVEYLGLTQML